jgi:putative transposase
VKQTLIVKLLPDPEQAASLLATLERFNAACDAIAAVAFREQIASAFALQRLVYFDIRARFGLSAQMTIRAIGKVCEVYKRDKTICPSFRPHGAMTYDERIMAWKGVAGVSLLTVGGRTVVPFVFGAYQAARMGRIMGQADLVYRDGRWFLHATIETPTPPASDPDGWLGVDMGIVNIATDSDGTTYAGAHLNGLRRRHRRLRRKLQAKGTKGSRRLLHRRRHKEGRHARHVNHTISKRLVAVAQGTGRGIALEELGGIRERVSARRPQRAALHSWSFAQLRSFVEYKAALAGVLVRAVDPRNTSRTCPACGHVAKANRISQDRFLCQSCGLAGLPDYFAAAEISRRAAGKPAIYSDTGTGPVAPG